MSRNEEALLNMQTIALWGCGKGRCLYGRKLCDQCQMDIIKTAVWALRKPRVEPGEEA